MFVYLYLCPFKINLHFIFMSGGVEGLHPCGCCRWELVFFCHGDSREQVQSSNLVISAN